MSYYFIRLKHTDEGWGPDLPEGIGFLLLADPGRQTYTFGLYLCDQLIENSESVTRVSAELAELLNSAEAYPPALALTREDVEAYPTQSPAEFSEELMERLRFHLERQASSPFFMARVRKTQPGYKGAGGYYWIVGYKDGMVSWVSRDYFVYRDPIGDFDLDAGELESRFGRP